MNNPVGIISMQFARPFTGAHLGCLQRIRQLGFEFVEMLVPEPEDQLDLAALREALAAAGLDVVLAVRVNPMRSISSEDPAARQGGLDYLANCIEIADALGARIIGGPLYGEPMVFAGRAPVPRSADDMKARADRMIEGLIRLAPQARAAGKVLALEPLNSATTSEGAIFRCAT